MAILVTGGAGFIGSHLCEFLVRHTEETVVCLDNFDPFYSSSIKHSNLDTILASPRFQLVPCSLLEKSNIQRLFDTYPFHTVYHLAGCAGVRPSLKNPETYITNNVIATATLLDCIKDRPIKLIAASSSSVYGNCTQTPFSENNQDLTQISPYAMSKKAMELLCQTYNALYNIPVACLRFFTVYGPRQRPDMAISLFTQKIRSGQEICLFNRGENQRDYTYIDDIIQGIINIGAADFDFDIINLGNSHVIQTTELVSYIEKALSKKARLVLGPPEPGDVLTTYSNIDKATSQYGYKPTVPIQEGISLYISWLEKQKVVISN